MIVILGLIILRLASGPTAVVAFAGLGVYALGGRQQAIYALALSCLFTLINPGIAPDSSAASAGRYIVMIGAALSAIIHGVILSGEEKGRIFVIATMILGCGIIVHSMIFSPVPDVSILKALSWTVAMSSLLACWGGMSINERKETINCLYAGLVAVMIVSLPLIVTSLGYLRNGWGFQGIINHPQAFGAVMALLSTLATTKMLSEERPSWFLIATAGTSASLIILSGARTAGLAFMAAICLSIVLVPWLSKRPLRILLPGLASLRVWAIFLGVVVICGVLASSVITLLGAYLSKGVESDSLADAYGLSRGKLIDSMIYNIINNPIRGIGFGISSDYYFMSVDRDEIIGLPLGAPIEKGVAVLAVVEELGAMSVLVFSWFFVLIFRCIRGGVTPAAIGIVIALFNLGEATFFSPGGLGIIFLIFIAWAYFVAPRGRRHA